MEQQKETPLELNDGNKNTLLAALSYLFILVLIPLLTAKEDSFVKFHIKQGLILFIIEVVTISLGKMFYLLHFFLGIINLVILVLVVIGIINVLSGKEKELPLVGRFARNFKF